MDIEEVKKFLSTEEGKPLVEDAIEKATEGLKTKNNELLGKMKKIKDDKIGLQTEFDDLKEEYEDLENAKTKKSDDVEAALKKQAEKHAKELEKITGERDLSQSEVKKLLIDNGLNSALIKANVSKEHIPAVTALLKTNNKIEITRDHDDSPIATIGDKPLGDFVKEFSESDSGKIYVSAPDNSGGGHRNINNGQFNSSGGQNLDKMDPTAKLEFARTQGQQGS